MTHAWVPVAPCDESCVRDDPVLFLGRIVRIVRGCWRTFLIFAVLPLMPFTAIPASLRTLPVSVSPTQSSMPVLTVFVKAKCLPSGLQRGVPR